MVREEPASFSSRYLPKGFRSRSGSLAQARAFEVAWRYAALPRGSRGSFDLFNLTVRVPPCLNAFFLVEHFALPRCRFSEVISLEIRAKVFVGPCPTDCITTPC